MKNNSISRIIYASAVGFLVGVSVVSLVTLDASAQESTRPVATESEHSPTNSERFSREEAQLADLESEVQLPNDASAQDAGIHVSLKLDKQVYTIGEPVNLRVEINNGNQYLLTEELQCNDVFLVNIFIRNAAGERLQLNESASRKRDELEMLRKWREGVGPEPAELALKRAEAKKRSSPGAIILLADDIRTGGGSKCIGSGAGLGGKVIEEFNVGKYYTISSPGEYSITYSSRMALKDASNSNFVNNVHISGTTALLVK
jgi:hypothetical protein